MGDWEKRKTAQDFCHCQKGTQDIPGHSLVQGEARWLQIPVCGLALGRNRLVVGQLLEEDFARLNVRYIAIMDNIDTANGVSDIVPMQDLFNEWHAKNTSDKVRRVMQSRGNAGYR